MLCGCGCCLSGGGGEVVRCESERGHGCNGRGVGVVLRCSAAKQCRRKLGDGGVHCQQSGKKCYVIFMVGAGGVAPCF